MYQLCDNYVVLRIHRANLSLHRPLRSVMSRNVFNVLCGYHVMRHSPKLKNIDQKMTAPFRYPSIWKSDRQLALDKTLKGRYTKCGFGHTTIHVHWCWYFV